MGDVTLVPESHVLESCLGVGPDHAGQPADLLAGYGVPLVRHGRGALLFFAEIFLRLADLGALQVTDLGRNFVEGGSNGCESGDVESMSVALNDLGRDRSYFETEAMAD